MAYDNIPSPGGNAGKVIASDGDKWTAQSLASLQSSGPVSRALVAWLKADAGVTLSGSDVTAWADQSSAGIISSYVQTSPWLPPQYTASGGPNNLPYLDFAGGRAVVSMTNLLGAGTPRTVFVAGKAHADIGGCLVSFRAAPTCALQLATQSGQIYLYSDGATLNGVINNAKRSNNIRADYTKDFVACYSTRGTGDILSLRMNGKHAPSDGFAMLAESGTAQTVIGDREDHAYGLAWDGLIYEVLIYNDYLTETEVAQVNDYLGAKWSVLVENEQVTQMESVSLWDGVPPSGSGDATLRVFIPPANVGTPGKRPCVIYCPGGGYAAVIPNAGRDVCMWLASLGIVGIVLEYRLPDAEMEFPGQVCVDDITRAVRLARAGAAGVDKSIGWGVDPDRIGVAGESAGGHLASTIATHYDDGDPMSGDPVETQSSKPNFSLLLWPIIEMQAPDEYTGATALFIASSGLGATYSNDLEVDKDTPPAFITWAEDDAVVSTNNSKNYLAALLAHGVGETDFISFATGDHGEGFPATTDDWTNWKRAFWTWFQRVVMQQPGVLEFGRFSTRKQQQIQHGRLSLSVAGSADVTLDEDQASAEIIEFTGELTGNINVIYPESLDGARIAIANLTSGDFTLTVKVAGQTGFVVTQGQRCTAYFDATDIVRLSGSI